MQKSDNIGELRNVPNHVTDSKKVAMCKDVEIISDNTDAIQEHNKQKKNTVHCM